MAVPLERFNKLLHHSKRLFIEIILQRCNDKPGGTLTNCRLWCQTTLALIPVKLRREIKVLVSFKKAQQLNISLHWKQCFIDWGSSRYDERDWTRENKSEIMFETTILSSLSYKVPVSLADADESLTYKKIQRNNPNSINQVQKLLSSTRHLRLNQNEFEQKMIF